MIIAVMRTTYAVLKLELEKKIRKRQKIYLFLCLTFLQEKKKSEAKQDEGALYSLPNKPGKQIAKEKKAPIYDTPQKPDKPVVQEPEDKQAPGFFNPLYQTRREVEQFPEDISSIFASPSPPPVQPLDDDDLGQSEC